jgi:hypothetical protein
MFPEEESMNTSELIAAIDARSLAVPVKREYDPRLVGL